MDSLARQYGLDFTRRQFHALVAHGRLAGEPAMLAKPLTFMNLSGNAVAPLMRFYKIPLSHLLVAYDDLDLPLGRLRLRPGGGSGGHKGVADIIERLGTEGFARLRIGIGRPPAGSDAVQYVLRDFQSEEQAQLASVFELGREAVLIWITEGIEMAMNRYNREPDLEG